MQHELILTARSLGGRRKGTNAGCTCQQWHGLFSNDKTPEQARRAKWGEQAHAKHVVSATVESDIEALKALIVKQQGWLAKDIEGGYALFIKRRAETLSKLVTQLLADMERQASGELAEMVEESDPESWVQKGDRMRAEHEEWMDAQTNPPDFI